MILRYLIEKEFRQLKRNSFLPRLIVLFPCMMMLVMPWAATLEIEDLRIAVIDNDHSPSSQRLVHRIEASPYFQLTALPSTFQEGMHTIISPKTKCSYFLKTFCAIFTSISTKRNVIFIVKKHLVMIKRSDIQNLICIFKY